VSTSIWERSNVLGRRRCEVCVVGAGICGLSAAAALEARGVDCCIVERAHPGAGASGRNAGYLMRGFADNYRAACRELGDSRAQALWRATERNRERLVADGIAALPSYAPRPSCLLALESDEERDLVEAADRLAADGFAGVRLVRPGDLVDGAWATGHARLGLVNEHDAVVDPTQLVGLLARRYQGPRLDGQPLLAVTEAGSRLALELAGGVLEADRVLVCTNAYASQVFPQLDGVVVPHRAQMLALDAPDLRLHCAYYANRGGEYFREAGGGRVICGGCRKAHAADEETWADHPTGAVQRAIEEFHFGLFGRRYPVVARWAGTMGFSPDGLPLVGPLADPRIWFVGAFTGHGMSLARVVAEEAVDAMLAGSEPPFSLARLAR